MAIMGPADMGRRGAARRWAKTTPAERSAHGRKLARSRWDSERAFAEVMAERGIELSYPAPRFVLASLGTTYRPDYESPSEGVFYEVIASSGAYGHNRHKYEALKVEHPTITLRIVTPDGEPYQPVGTMKLTPQELSEGIAKLGAAGGRKAWKDKDEAERAEIMRERWETRRRKTGKRKAKP